MFTTGRALMVNILAKWLVLWISIQSKKRSPRSFNQVSRRWIQIWATWMAKGMNSPMFTSLSNSTQGLLIRWSWVELPEKTWDWDCQWTAVEGWSRTQNETPTRTWSRQSQQMNRIRGSTQKTIRSRMKTKIWLEVVHRLMWRLMLRHLALGCEWLPQRGSTRVSSTVEWQTIMSLHNSRSQRCPTSKIWATSNSRRPLLLPRSQIWVQATTKSSQLTLAVQRSLATPHNKQTMKKTTSLPTRIKKLNCRQKHKNKWPSKDSTSYNKRCNNKWCKHKRHCKNKCRLKWKSSWRLFPKCIKTNRNKVLNKCYPKWLKCMKWMLDKKIQLNKWEQTRWWRRRNKQARLQEQRAMKAKRKLK